jgi:hypothetical protein
LLAGVLHKNCKYGIGDKIASEKKKKPETEETELSVLHKISMSPTH